MHVDIKSVSALQNSSRRVPQYGAGRIFNRLNQRLSVVNFVPASPGWKLMDAGNHMRQRLSGCFVIVERPVGKDVTLSSVKD